MEVVEEQVSDFFLPLVERSRRFTHPILKPLPLKTEGGEGVIRPEF